jgi:hypothetical protein
VFVSDTAGWLSDSLSDSHPAVNDLRVSDTVGASSIIVAAKQFRLGVWAYEFATVVAPVGWLHQLAALRCILAAFGVDAQSDFC